MQETLTVFYNGACPICGAEVRHYMTLARASDAPLDWVDISREPQALRPYGIDGATAKRRLYATEGGRHLYAGVDAFARLWERLPRYRWLARFTRRPMIAPIAEIVYERILAPGLYRYNRWRERRRG